MTRVTPTTTDHWKAFAGRTALLFLGALLIAGLLMGFSRSLVAGLLFGVLIGLPQHIRAHRFLVNRLSVDEESDHLILHGQRFNWSFEPEERRIALAGLAQIELSSRQWWENADELQLVGKNGISESVKVVPQFLTQVEVKVINERLGAAVQPTIETA
jgi:hypothetical protein